MDIYNGYKRFHTHSVNVGCSVIGANNPIAIQSMGCVDSNDIDAGVTQALQIEASGASIVRFTAQGVREANSLGEIKRRLVECGSQAAIVADIHFNAEAAFTAAPLLDKVRINPGNFSSEAEVYNRLKKLIDICRESSTTLRVGVNHGSLSPRMMERYGDTTDGMVESAMEYLRIAQGLAFDDIVVSLKSSNTFVMVNAYRAMVRAMANEGMSYPLHLGVTEAGNGMEGRSRSAVGIGTLLSEGIGDTIRVSLTENPTHEAPFARLLLECVEREVKSAKGVDAAPFKCNSKGAVAPFVTDGCDICYTEVSYDIMRETELKGDVVVVNEPSFFKRRAAIEWLTENSNKKVVVKCCYSLERDAFIAALGVDLGGVLLDGYLDGVWIENSAMLPNETSVVVYDILQATRRRITAPEYISCPTCGRTKYDIESVLREVKERTKGLKNIKIAVMGCIVNGPGEMADADYGYVGAGVGKVVIYRKGEVYKRNIDERVAIDELMQLLRDDNQFA